MTWAVPVDDDGVPVPLPGRQVVHAPTPSDEPCRLPVRLIAPFPLGPDRRHVAPRAGDRRARGRGRDVLADLPGRPAARPALLRSSRALRLAGADLDAAVCAAVLDRLRATAWLPEAGEEARIPPARATVLDDATPERIAALTGVLPGLLPPGWSSRAGDGRAGRAGRAAHRARRGGGGGARRRPAAGLVGPALRGAGRRRPRGAGRAARAAGRRADRARAGRGAAARGGAPRGRLSALGLRLAEPEAVALPAARRLLERLGARPATPAAVLADPAVRAAVRASLEAVEDVVAGAPDPDELADAVLALVAAAGPAADELPWLAELALPDADGGWAPAGELLLPGSPLADVLEPGALGVLDPAFAATADAGALRRIGVLGTFAVVSAEDPEELDVDGADEWVDAVLDRLPADAPPPAWPALTAVRDLELVADWPAALPLLAALPAAAWDDVRAGRGGGPGYLRWWLSHPPRARRAAPRPAARAGPGPLQGLYEPADADAGAARPAAPARHRRRRAGRRGRRDGPAASAWATAPAPCGGRAPDGLRTAGRGAGRGGRRAAATGAGGPGPGGRPTPSSSTRRGCSHWCEPTSSPPGAPRRGGRPAGPAPGRRDGRRAPSAGRRAGPALGGAARRRPGGGPAGPGRADRRGGGGRAARRRRDSGAVVAGGAGPGGRQPGGARPGTGLAGRPVGRSGRRWPRPSRTPIEPPTWRPRTRVGPRSSASLGGASLAPAGDGGGSGSVAVRRRAATAPVRRRPGSGRPRGPGPAVEQRAPLRAGERRRAGGRRQAFVPQPLDPGGAGQLGAQERPQRRRRGGQDGVGEPVEGGGVGLGQAGAGVGRGAVVGGDSGVTRGTSGRGRCGRPRAAEGPADAGERRRRPGRAPVTAAGPAGPGPAEREGSERAPGRARGPGSQEVRRRTE